jgi:hypothetical protein
LINIILNNKTNNLRHYQVEQNLCKNYLSETYFESHFQTKTRSAVSACIDYLNGLLFFCAEKNDDSP